MGIHKIIGDLDKLSEKELERRFEKFLADNPDRFGLVSEKYKEVVKDLIAEYRGEANDGQEVSRQKIVRDTRRLYMQRRVIGLSTDDLELIRELLNQVAGGKK